MWGQWTYTKLWFAGFPPLLGVGTVDILLWACLPERAEMSRGCLFPDSVPNRDVTAQIANLNWQGKDPTWIGWLPCVFSQRTESLGIISILWHIYYIHIRTVVKEANKGRCTVVVKPGKELLLSISIFQSARLITYLGTDPCTRTKKRLWLPQFWH